MPWRSRAVALLAIVGPGLLAGLSDDDPAGITTYSIVGADYGYSLLWVLVLSTAALVVFHELAARMGIVTGQGLLGLVRARYGVRWGVLALAALLAANVGTTCAELAGIGAALEMAGVPLWVSVPLAGAGVSALVLLGGFRRVEHVLIALSAVFVTYVVAAVLAEPDWGAAARGLAIPSLDLSRDAALVVVAMVGTTLAPWGIAFLQSYAADKRLTTADLRAERVDVVVGAALTGIIGAFIVITCAATLHTAGLSIGSAKEAAVALEPLAGGLATALFGAGLLGAGLLALSILPLSTAYAVCDAIGAEAALDDRYADARLFYGTYGVVVVVAGAIVLIPGVPLIDVLFLSQALNAALLPPLLWCMRGVGCDRRIMGDHALGPAGRAATLASIVLVVACVALWLVLGLA
ncbi:MAG TPA: divalent metal cation transporter [Solirubrobacteraceae bacterium]|nr:divalent metal cation transporter [Solirubrobacteraceae bacterium]